MPVGTVALVSTRAIFIVAGSAVALGALIAWLLVPAVSSGPATLPSMAGAVGMGSPAASPFPRISAAPSAVAEPAPRTRLRATRRVPVAPGAKAWRFEPLPLGGASAGTLYARIAQRPNDPANAENVALFAEAVAQCRADRLRRQIETQRAQRVNASVAASPPPVSDPASEARAALCIDLPADAAERSDGWLLDAAARGDPRAQFMVATGFYARWIDDPALLHREPQRLVEQRTRETELLEQLAGEGHYDSLRFLSQRYSDPLFGEDRALAWAYAMAAFKGANNFSAQTQLIEQLSALSPLERQRAERESNRIFNRCCR